MAWCGRSTKSKWKTWKASARRRKNSKRISKQGTDKLEYHLGDTEELIESGDIKEMAIVCKRTDEILDRLIDLVSQMQELKLEPDVYTPRTWGAHS